MGIRHYTRKGDYGLSSFIALLAATYNTNVCITHIAGTENAITDCLSCFQQDKFKKLAPLANPAPNSIPAWLT